MLEGIPIADLTAPGLVGIAVLMVLFGLLVPRRTYNDKVEENKRLWLALETSEKARAASDAQAREMLELTKTSHAMITAIFQSSSDAVPRQTGGRRDVV